MHFARIYIAFVDLPARARSSVQARFLRVWLDPSEPRLPRWSKIWVRGGNASIQYEANGEGQCKETSIINKVMDKFNVGTADNRGVCSWIEMILCVRSAISTVRLVPTLTEHLYTGKKYSVWRYNQQPTIKQSNEWRRKCRDLSCFQPFGKIRRGAN